MDIFDMFEPLENDLESADEVGDINTQEESSEGIFNRQYKRIMRARGDVEDLVLSCLLNDLSLYNEYKLSEKDFVSEQGKFLFGLGRTIGKKYAEIDEININDIVSKDKELKKHYKSIGGFKIIEEILNKGNQSNVEAYVDELLKNNFLLKRSNKEIFIKEREINGIKVNPFKELFPQMTSKEVEEFFISDLSSDAINTMTLNKTKGESLLISREELEGLKNGDAVGTPYNVLFEYEKDNKEEVVKAFEILSNMTNGVSPCGGLYEIAGYSGLGKSTFSFELMLSLVKNGEVVDIFSNEQKSIYFKSMLYSIIANEVFGHKLTRRTIENGTFDEYEEELMGKINDFIVERELDKNIKFYSLEEFKIDEIVRITRRDMSLEGTTTILIDTFKSEDSSNQQYVGALIEATKKLDDFGRKHNINVFVTLQCTPANENMKSYLSASDLSDCKGSKYVASVLLLMRRVVNELELDSENKKYFLAPYKPVERISRRSGKPTIAKEEVEFSDKDIANGQYRLVFLNKNRRGEDNQVILYKFKPSGKFEEIGICTNVYRGTF